jgi:hypothetical protein
MRPRTTLCCRTCKPTTFPSLARAQQQICMSQCTMLHRQGLRTSQSTTLLLLSSPATCLTAVLTHIMQVHRFIALPASATLLPLLEMAPGIPSCSASALPSVLVDSKESDFVKRWKLGN